MFKGVQLSLLTGMQRQSPAPQDAVDALESATATVKSGEVSGFQLVFTLGKKSRLNERWAEDGLFDPPQRLILVVTFNGTPHVIMDGVVTQLSITPSNQPGQSKLTVTGEDLSRLMDMVDSTGIPFPAMPYEARVGLLLSKYAAFGVVPKILPSVMVGFVPLPIETIESLQGTDLGYIQCLAKRVGYVFYVEPGPEPGMSIAYWGPEIKTGSTQPSLIVNSDSWNNASLNKIEFDGFKKTQFILILQEPNSKAPMPIPVPDITPLNPPLGRKPVLPLLARQLRELAEQHPAQAVSAAVGQASRASDVIAGEGNVDVLRYGRLLKARQLVDVRGAGPSLDGSYFVRSVTHNIKRGSYQQGFTLSRNALFPT